MTLFPQCPHGLQSMFSHLSNSVLKNNFRGIHYCLLKVTQVSSGMTKTQSCNFFLLLLRGRGGVLIICLAILELLDASDPPARAFWVAGTTSMSHLELLKSSCGNQGVMSLNVPEQAHKSSKIHALKLVYCTCLESPWVFTENLFTCRYNFREISNSHCPPAIPTWEIEVKNYKSEHWL